MGLRTWLAVVVLGSAVGAVSHAASPPLPYRISIAAAYGDPLGPESLRDELERELVARLRKAECFLGVEAQTAETAHEADLIVEVIIDRFDQGMHYDVSIATQHREDGDPDSKRQYSAGVEAVLYLQVRRAKDRALVKMERSNAGVSHHAEPGVDVRFEVYADLVDMVVRKTRSFLCKPSQKKWEKQIRQARLPDPAD